MKRRNCLQLLLGLASLSAARVSIAEEVPVDESMHPIQLHLDLAVDPGKARDMLRIFEEEFRPAAAKQPGFIDARMLKLSTILRGPAPPGSNYQLILTFQSESARQNWVATSTHKALWPKIEATLASRAYSRLLYEVY